MRYTSSTLLLICLGIASLLSCKKEDNNTPLLASVNIVHAVVNVPAIKVNYFGSTVIYRTYTDSVKYGAYKIYSLGAGPEAPLTIIPMLDTTKSLLSGSLGLTPGGMYSLFLSGQYPSTDTLLVQDHISNYTDSLVGVRFINLSPGSSPVSINIKNNQSDPEVSSLAYKQITNFKTYPATTGISNYVFEVRDAVSGTLLVSFTCTITKFHNHTLVLKGLVGGSGVNALGMVQVNNFL